jgi:hypothetical protein
MLLIHSARFAILADTTTKPAEMRSDILQFNTASSGDNNARETVSRNDNTGDTISKSDSTGDTISKWASIPLRLVRQSEPFVIQATLVGTVQTGLSCRASNIFKSLFLLVPPGLARFAPTNAFPPTFYDEYQPILYPNLTYGTGGNIWAEMLCRFGPAGVALFGLLLIAALTGLQNVMLKCSTAWIAPIALGGVVMAFYIHRNDLHYTLVMLRQIGFVFAAAYGLSAVSGRIWSRLFGKAGQS